MRERKKGRAKSWVNEELWSWWELRSGKLKSGVDKGDVREKKKKGRLKQKKTKKKNREKKKKKYEQ